ncbi:hypothetical protein BURMUCGD2M_2619 [Burkholderia multivorans CGD2M]|uniref:Uncharacterized protein n=1 Tax=Burkholderia multivorans CGD2 TaxID=513052 RepID=B9BXB4_9BURK|nr:hypothetical protein BURMUCGD2_2533 [Burkholderia multivorans CGD2]EEE11123.1 hypothetical protein BURMUCGD2M_2619 [Burkholderia multivorans CGD2M]
MRDMSLPSAHGACAAAKRRFRMIRSRAGAEMIRYRFVQRVTGARRMLRV